MHISRMGVKKTVDRFCVGGKEIGVVEEYKYLESVVNEYLRMGEERGRVGAKALSDWLRKCRAAVGEVTIVRLLELLVESVLLYGAEVWGVWRTA